jgi:carboxyl-terminal processing protease
VTPDIILPDNFFYIKTGERDREYAMEWTEIDPVEYDQDVLEVDNISKLRSRSEKRIEENEAFQKILANAKRVEQQREESAYPIGLEAYREMREKRQQQADEFDGVMDQVVLENISNLEEDLPGIQADESKKARNDEWLESVSKDIYIKETLAIMHDMIEEK